MPQKLDSIEPRKLTVDQFIKGGGNPYDIQPVKPKAALNSGILSKAKSIKFISIQRFRLLVSIYLCSGLLTSLGFFIAQAPLFVAYLPFLVALILNKRAVTVALVAGHFAVAAGIATWGLVDLGFPTVFIIPAAIGFMFAIGFIYAYLGFAIASATLFVLAPFFPGNPLLMAGALYPNQGLVGIGLFLLVSLALNFWKTPQTRIGILLLIGAIPSLFIWSMQDDVFGRYIGVSPQPMASRALDGFEAKPISESHALNGFRQLKIDLVDVAKQSRVITGENVLNAGNAEELRSLCQTAKAGALDLFVGVQAANGQREVWSFNTQTCPTPLPVYSDVVGIPGLKGAVTKNAFEAATKPGLSLLAPKGMGFLASFEAFSIHRWIAMGQGKHDSVVVISNDSWTEPLPVALLRKKVSAELGRLFNIKIGHANAVTGGAILIQEARIE